MYRMRSSPRPSVQYRHAAARELAWRDTGPAAFSQAVRPHQLTSFSVERDDGSPGPAGCIEDAVDGQWRSFQLVLRPWSEDVRLEAPGNFEILEVRRVDLVERRILRAANVRGVMRPIALRRGRLTWGGGAVLTRDADGDASHDREQANQSRLSRHCRLPFVSAAFYA